MTDEITRDAFFGGRLSIAQPTRGHRSGTDAVLLAAAVPRDFAGLVYDVGAGVGVAGLGVALACANARVRLLERDPLAAQLALENITANGLSERCDVLCRDLLRNHDAMSSEAADIVVTNPPFWKAHQVRASPHDGRSAAHVFDPDVTLADWLVKCLDLLSAKGTLILIHAPMALPEIFATLDRWLGEITLMPIHPHAGTAAKRVLVRGKKGSRAPLAIAAPLVLHDGERFTPIAERLHQGLEPLVW